MIKYNSLSVCAKSGHVQEIFIFHEHLFDDFAFSMVRSILLPVTGGRQIAYDPILLSADLDSL